MKTAILFVGQEKDIYCIEGLQLDISIKETETVKLTYSFWAPLPMNGYIHDLITQGWVQILTLGNTYHQGFASEGSRQRTAFVTL